MTDQESFRTIGWRGPAAGSYLASVGLVLLALAPFLMLTAAVIPVLPELSKAVGLSKETLYIVLAMSDAAYAFGTVLAVQLAVHLPGRRMLLVYVTTFVVAAALAAWAPDGPVFAAAFIVEGLCTSLMLIAAVPPLVTGWPPEKMPWTGMVMNLGIFGAVAVGPTVGYLQLSSGAWRPLFAGVAGLGALALLFVILTFEDVPPQDTSAPWDFVAITLAGGGCAAAFYGAGRLEATGAADAASLVPLVAGIAMIAVLVVHQYRIRRPLMPVRQLATTLPVTGILIALFASASSFGLMELLMTVLSASTTPTRAALMFLPEFGAAVAMAGVFGALFSTRFTPVLAMGGMVVLSAGAAVLTELAAGGSLVFAIGAGLIGVGVGASVSPALFLAGFSLRSNMIQRVFALIELLRGVTAFLVAPILIYLTTVIGATVKAGITGAVWICLGLAAGGGAIAAGVFFAGAGRLRVPDLRIWSEGEPAWESPPLFSRLRGATTAERDSGAACADE
ncbi:MAG: MFS transporter [Streptosporangiaceae bacterium]